jgi:hypothetical protein
VTAIGTGTAAKLAYSLETFLPTVRTSFAEDLRVLVMASLWGCLLSVWKYAEWRLGAGVIVMLQASNFRCDSASPFSALHNRLGRWVLFNALVVEVRKGRKVTDTAWVGLS